MRGYVELMTALGGRRIQDLLDEARDERLIRTAREQRAADSARVSAAWAAETARVGAANVAAARAVAANVDAERVDAATGARSTRETLGAERGDRTPGIAEPEARSNGARPRVPAL